MVGRSLKDFLVGALVGVMSMMPGASGGIIAVIFASAQHCFEFGIQVAQHRVVNAGYLLALCEGFRAGRFVDDAQKIEIRLIEIVGSVFQRCFHDRRQILFKHGAVEV